MDIGKRSPRFLFLKNLPAAPLESPGTPARAMGRSMVGVAQLVEPRVVIPVVVGSSPIVHPIFRGWAVSSVGRAGDS